jgi:hypothetical protein
MAMHEGSSLQQQPYQGADARRDHALFIRWSGIVGGTVVGWGIFSLLTLVGTAVGFAKFDPYSVHPANGLDVGSAIFGVIALVVSSFVGAYVAMRIAGVGRRSEALTHGAICWGFSMLLGGMLALNAAQTAAQSTATVASGPRAQAKVQRESNARANSGGPTQADRDRAAETARTAAKASGAAAGGAFLALIAALLGGVAGAHRTSGRTFSDDLRLRRKAARESFDDDSIDDRTDGGERGARGNGTTPSPLT